MHLIVCGGCGGGVVGYFMGTAGSIHTNRPNRGGADGVEWTNNRRRLCVARGGLHGCIGASSSCVSWLCTCRGEATTRPRSNPGITFIKKFEKIFNVRSRRTGIILSNSISKKSYDNLQCASLVL